MSNKKIATQKWHEFRARGLCPCGISSTKRATVNVRRFIEDTIRKYEIKSISDAPCGQYSLWTHLVDFQDASYIGYDINGELIDYNRMEFPDVEFHQLDIVSQILPKTDLIICRDCLFHLPDTFITLALNNFKQSGSRYLMTPTYDWVKRNRDLKPAEREREYGFRPINLLLSPYNMEPYIDSMHEIVPRPRTLGLWRLN